MDVAAAAAAGVTEFVVRRRPVVAVLPTGDEIRPVGTEPATGEIIDTNSLMLAGQAREHGCDAVCLPIEPDDPARIAEAARAAAATADLVVLVAGRRRHRGPLQALLDMLSFRSAVEGLGGYSCANTGRRIR